MPPQSRVGLAMLVQIRCSNETSIRLSVASIVRAVQEEEHALPNVDKSADFATTLGHVLEATTFVLVSHAADCLRAEYGTAEEAYSWVGDLFTGCRTPALDRLLAKRVVGLGQADQLENSWVSQRDRSSTQLSLVRL